MKIFIEVLNIFYVTQKGISALMYAIQLPNEEMVKVLVEGGANLNSANEVS